jgi:hypothetical protein
MPAAGAAGLAFSTPQDRHICVLRACLCFFPVQVNNNSFGLAPADQNVAVGTLAPGGSGSAQVPMAFNAAKLAQGPSNMKLQVRGPELWCCLQAHVL